VSVIDSVCLCLRRSLLEQIGGLDERYGFYHGFDKDLCLAVRERGLRCRVMYAPFRHHGGGTRAKDFQRDPDKERRDLADREAVLRRLREKWGHRLPADARPLRTRLREWLRAHIVYSGRR
jgi:GT2 family glycosyltransferase